MEEWRYSYGIKYGTAKEASEEGQAIYRAADPVMMKNI
jgi:hypothetical protein